MVNELLKNFLLRFPYIKRHLGLLDPDVEFSLDSYVGEAYFKVLN